MDDQGKRDHWDSLVSALGATPTEPAEEPAEPETTPQAEVLEELAPAAAPEDQAEDILASLPQSTYSPARPEKQKTPQDWAKLAGELGIEIPPESLASSEETVVSTVVEAAETPPIVVTTLEPAVDWESGGDEEARSAAEDELTPVGDDERRGRRRRKRRRRGARPSEEGEALPEIEGPLAGESQELEPEATEARDDFDDVLALPDEAAEAAGAEPTAEDEESPDRAKRRRRRKKKSARPRVEAGEAELAESRQRVESIEERAFDADDDQFAAPELDESDDEHEPGPHEERAVHRAIPTWQEAVNLVIAVNLESRARSPDRRSSHRPRGRGGRSD